MSIRVAFFARACVRLLLAGFLFQVVLAGPLPVRAQEERGAAASRYSHFDVEVVVRGRRLEDLFARGRRYVEALEGEEYELRLRNPLPVRVAVALSVDGLNTIDARRTSSWESSKWVIEPYQTITISGWQMSSRHARRFYFTTERDSYAARLGKTSGLGIISAVVYREAVARPVPVTPPPPYREEMHAPRDGNSRREAETDASSKSRSGRSGNARPQVEEDYAATGIGRPVEHDVTWIQMRLERRPLADINIRYEYRDALVRLGVLPRPRHYDGDILRRRERARGFEPEPGFSPEP